MWPPILSHPAEEILHGVAQRGERIVFNDSTAIDMLTGGGTDWYFRALDDVITDLVAGETLDLL